MAANPNVNGLAVNSQKIPIPPVPPYPKKLTKVFPELEEHHRQLEEWRKKVQIAVHGVPGP